MELKDNRRTAVLSDDRVYRYRLTRRWDPTKQIVAFIMLNPSTANETENDPTIRRCIQYAKDWGFGQLQVANLFGLRATDPDGLTDHPDPVGPENDEHLINVAKTSAGVVAAWGAKGSLHGRGREVVGMLADEGIHVSALATTKEGHPVHPLYQPADAKPEPFAYGEEVRSGGER